MKKIFATLLAASLMLLGTQAFAQISVNAGYLNSSMKVGSADPSNANGAYAGVSFNVPLVGGLAIAPGVYYSMITSKSTASLGTIASGSGTQPEETASVAELLLDGAGKFFYFRKGRLDGERHFLVFGVDVTQQLRYGLGLKMVVQ